MHSYLHKNFILVKSGCYKHLLEGPLSMFFKVDGGAPGSLAPPPRGPSLSFFSIDGGCSRISDIAPRGLIINVF
jgi:hypothetical protein